jgi:ABC-type uncharacterized transport system substrate-binding protein
MDRFSRRELLGVIASGLTWPRVTSAQTITHLIGYLNLRSPSEAETILLAFRQGLQEQGYVEGRNVSIEQRWAEGHYNRASDLAEELVRLNVDVLVATGGTGSAVAAKAATSSIPIVFAMGGDPVKLGVVSSLSRPEGNATGISFLVNGMAAKEIELLHDLVPKATAIAFFVNADDPNTESDARDAQEEADKLGLRLQLKTLRSAIDIDKAFDELLGEEIQGLLVNTDPFLALHRAKITQLANAHAIPAVSALEGFAAAGGLMNYGTSITEANHQLGVYTGLILKGTKARDLPIVQPTHFKFVINLRTARKLNLHIPDKMLAQADELIE